MINRLFLKGRLLAPPTAIFALGYVLITIVVEAFKRANQIPSIDSQDLSDGVYNVRSYTLTEPDQEGDSATYEVVLQTFDGKLRVLKVKSHHLPMRYLSQGDNMRLEVYSKESGSAFYSRLTLFVPNT